MKQVAYLEMESHAGGKIGYDCNEKSLVEF